MSHSPATTPPSAAEIAPPVIVVALTARERALFFGAIEAAPFRDWHLLADDDLTPEHWSGVLERLRPTVLITAWKTPALPDAWLNHPDCPLRYVCHVTGSVRRLLPRAFLERGGVATNWGETVSAQVAEHALLLALAALRNAGAWRTFIGWPTATRRIEDLATRTLFGRRVGLHGFGSIARALVPLLRPFDVTVCAWSAGVPVDLMHAAGVTPCASLPDLFEQSEVLFECEALTATTAGIVSAALLARLPDDAVFVNIGRGGLVDEAALEREAARGRLRVALDVAVAEPLTPASPFVALPQVILSPHIGGPTRDRYRQCGEFALANLRSFLGGETPAAAISLAAYDRAT